MSGTEHEDYHFVGDFIGGTNGFVPQFPTT